MTSLDGMSTVVCLVVVSVVCCVVECAGPSRQHGGIQMGVSNALCDNAQWRLWVDWDNSTDYEYHCQPDEMPIDVIKATPKQSCIDNEDIPLPLHKCMSERVVYADQPPRGGPHRPLWPVYGEYLYLPPQRWVHNMEHGGVAFLYHPCADRAEIEKLKAAAKSCLRRHVITPYRHLPLTSPLAIVTYGCKLTMSYVDVNVCRQFIKENAINPDRASEANVWQDGQYSYGLLEQAAVVPGSDITDSRVCPDDTFDADAMVEENMI